MPKKGLVTLIFISSLLLSGCSLPWSKKTPTPTSTPPAVRLNYQTAPFATLTITADKKTGGISGHTFTMNLANLNQQAKTIEYLFLYDLPDGRQQGIPGVIDLGGKTSIIRDDLLMGSCSKVCRFDEGVKKGTIQFTYRDANGETIGDILGDWHLQSSTQKYTSVDGIFDFQSARKTTGWFITMTSLGLPKEVTGKLISGPYTITSSSAASFSGLVSITTPDLPDLAGIFIWDGSSWKALADTKIKGQTISAPTTSLGTFVVVSPQ